MLARRGNQQSLNAYVLQFLEDSATEMAQTNQTNKGHGRIETRTASISSNLAWLQGRHQCSLAAVGKITTSPQEGDHSSVESR